MNEYRTVKVPSGTICIYAATGKPCKLAMYVKKSGKYTCRLYGKMLDGQETPKKCKSCYNRESV